MAASDVLTRASRAIEIGLCDFALPLIRKLRECPMSSHGGLLAYSVLSYSGTVGGCPVPECIAVSWAHINVCERFHVRNLQRQQRSLRFGIPRSSPFIVECRPTGHPLRYTGSFIATPNDQQCSAIDMFPCLWWTVEWQFSTLVSYSSADFYACD